ncbi:MAG: PH domain-containing protein [Planctomycetota bacterium]
MLDQEQYIFQPAMARGIPLLFLLCLLLVPVGIGILALLWWWLWTQSASLTIGDDYAALETGVLSKTLNEVLLKDIRNVQIVQGPIQRIANSGRLNISTAGQGNIEISIDGLVDPYEIKSFIDERRNVGRAAT